MDKLLPAYTSIRTDKTGLSVWEFYEQIEAKDVDGFMQKMKGIISVVPYDNLTEKYLVLREQNYQTAVYLIFKIMGFFVQTEAHCATGRADCVVHTQNTIYLFEFKLWSKGTAEKALAQIKEKEYAEPFRNEGKKIVAIGVSFNNAKHSIKEWKSEIIE